MIETQVLTYPGVVERLGRWLADRIAWVWVAVVIVYAAGFTGRWLPGPDAATHVLLAEAIATDGSLDHPEGALRKIEPGLAYTIVLLRGIGGWPVVQAGMIVAALKALVLWYLAVRVAAGREIAAGSLVLMALCECVYRYAFQALTDMPFAASVGAVVLGYELLSRRPRVGGRDRADRRWAAARWATGLLLVAVGLAWCAAFRSVWLIVLAAVGTATLIDLGRRRRWGALIGVGVAAAVAVALGGWWVGWGHDEAMMWSRLTEGLPLTLWQLLTVNLPRLLGESVSEAMIALDAGWWVALPVTVVGLAGAVSLAWRTRQTLWLTLLGCFVVQWLLFMVVDRYALPVMAILAAGWWWVAWSVERWVAQRRDRPAGAAAAIFLLALWIVPNAIAMGHVLVQFRDDPYREASRYDLGRYAGMRPAADWLAEHGGQGGAGGAAILNRTRAASDVWAAHAGLMTYDGGRQKPWAEHGGLWVVAPIEDGPGKLRRAVLVERVEGIDAPIGVWRVEVEP